MKYRKPGSTRPHYTVEGSRMDRAIGLLHLSGEMTNDAFTRLLCSISDTKGQAINLRHEMVKRGFIEKRVGLTDMARQLVQGKS